MRKIYPKVVQSGTKWRSRVNLRKICMNFILWSLLFPDSSIFHFLLNYLILSKIKYKLFYKTWASKMIFFVPRIFYMNFDFKNRFKMHLRMITKNHAAAPGIRFLTKSILKLNGYATVMPTAWELIFKFYFLSQISKMVIF